MSDMLYVQNFNLISLKLPHLRAQICRDKASFYKIKYREIEHENVKEVITA